MFSSALVLNECVLATCVSILCIHRQYHPATCNYQSVNLVNFCELNFLSERNRMSYSRELFHWTVIMVVKHKVDRSAARLSSDRKKHTKVQRTPALHTTASLQPYNRLICNLCFEIAAALTLEANQAHQGRVGTKPPEVPTARPVQPRFTNSLFFKITKSFSFDGPEAKLKKNGRR